MPIDPAPLAHLAAQFMDDIEQEYGEDAALVDALIIVEVHHVSEDDDDGDSVVEARVLSKRNVAAIGLATRGLAACLNPD